MNVFEDEMVGTIDLFEWLFDFEEGDNYDRGN